MINKNPHVWLLQAQKHVISLKKIYFNWEPKASCTDLCKEQANHSVVLKMSTFYHILIAMVLL